MSVRLSMPMLQREAQRRGWRLKWNPMQPRAPKGSSLGGEWIDGGPARVMGNKGRQRLQAQVQQFHKQNEPGRAQARTRVTALLAQDARLAGADPADLQALIKLYAGGRGSTSTDPSVLLDQWVAAATNLWAGTSGDSNAMAVAYQMAVQQEFQLDSIGTTAIPSATLDRATGIMADYEQELRALARAQYTATQNYLAEQGVDFVTVVRGMQLPGDPAGKPESLSITSHAISSYSLDSETAASFAGGGESDAGEEGGVGYEDAEMNRDPPPASSAPAPSREGGVVLVQTLPRQAIFGVPMSSLGTAYEQEVVVLGGAGSARTVYATDHVNNHDYAVAVDNAIAGK